MLGKLFLWAASGTGIIAYRDEIGQEAADIKESVQEKGIKQTLSNLWNGTKETASGVVDTIDNTRDNVEGAVDFVRDPARAVEEKLTQQFGAQGGAAGADNEEGGSILGKVLKYALGGGAAWGVGSWLKKQVTGEGIGFGTALTIGAIVIGALNFSSIKNALTNAFNSLSGAGEDNKPLADLDVNTGEVTPRYSSAQSYNNTIEGLDRALASSRPAPTHNVASPAPEPMMG